MKLTILVLAFLTLALPAFAEVRTITATGEYRMSEYDTPADAKLLAFQAAKRIVLEQASAYLSTITAVKALSLGKDEIHALSGLLLEVTQYSAYSTMEGQQQIDRVEATCTIDTDIVVHELDALRTNERLKAHLLKSMRTIEKVRQNNNTMTRELASIRSQTQADKIREARRLQVMELELERLLFQAMFLMLRDNERGRHGAYSPPVLRRVTDLTRQALALDPLNLTVHGLLGLLLTEGANLDETISAYCLAAGVKPDEADTHYFQGLSLFTRNDNSHYNGEKAIVEFREAIRLRPDDGYAYYFLGNVLTSSDRPDRLEEAIAAYRTAVKVKPDFASAYVEIGKLLLSRDPDGAITAFRTAIQLKPRTDASVHYELGSLLFYHKKDVESAITELETAIRIDDSIPIYYAVLAEALKDRGDLESAIGEYRTAIRLYPEKWSSYLHNDLGLALQANGDLEGAIAAFRTAIRLDTNPPSYHYNLGTALQSKRDFKGAIAAYRAAIQKADWFYGDAQFSLAVTLQAAGQRAAAVREFREFVRRAPDTPDNQSRIIQANTAIRKLK